jgi:hypothetical protein
VSAAVPVLLAGSAIITVALIAAVIIRAKIRNSADRKYRPELGRQGRKAHRRAISEDRWWWR